MLSLMLNCVENVKKRQTINVYFTGSSKAAVEAVYFPLKAPLCLEISCRISGPTCSLVVLPLATSTMWKPVRPATGMKKRPATHITASLGAQGVKEPRETRTDGQSPLFNEWPMDKGQRFEGYVTMACRRSTLCRW